MIIGISGYARSGKDTVADILVNKHGFIKLSFADKLRDVLYALDPIVSISYTNFGGKTFDSDTMELWTVQKVIDEFGWTSYKETEYGPEIRRLLQRLGTEAGRQVLGENVWVDAVRNEIAKHPVGTNFVIPDCRFPNEAKIVGGYHGSNYNGVMWRVRRPGINAVNAHKSETALDDWHFDKYIDNEGTLEQLENQVTRLWNIINPNFKPIVGAK